MAVIRLDTGSVTPGSARAATNEMLRDLSEEFRFNAELVVSELVTNAIIHGGGVLWVTLSLDDECFLIEVADARPESPWVSSPAQDEAGGRGMLIVSTIASSWSFRTNSTGKLVSAELRREEL